jgi:hypothetical protein
MCKKLVFFPQFGATCWFNALLMATLYSQQSRELLLAASKSWDTRIKIYKIFKHILHHKYMRSNHAEKDFKFFRDIKPENILTMLFNYNSKKFMLSDFSQGFLAEMYIKRFYKMLGASCMLMAAYNDKIQYDLYNHVKSVEIMKNGKAQIQFDLKDMKYVMNKLNETPDVLIVRCLDQNIGNAYRQYQFVEQNNAKNIRSMKDVITYNNQEYELDSVILTNWNIAEEGGHAIAGVTCNNERYVYNGWTSSTVDPVMKAKNVNTRLPCELMKFAWDVKEDTPFCLNSKQCKLDMIYNDPPKDVCFSFGKGRRILIYIRKGAKKEVQHYSPTTPEYVSLGKECPDGKVRDPITHRCVSLKTAMKRKAKLQQPPQQQQDVKPVPNVKGFKECKDGKIRDPVTKRCINLKTAVKRNLVSKNVLQLPDCKDGKIRDPQTRRCVSIKTAKKRKLID